MEFTLNSPLTEEDLDKIYDVDMDSTDSVTFRTKHGKEVEFVKPVRCKDCVHAEHWYGDRGRCFLWHEDGIGVFEDGFCNYGKRRGDEQNG